VSIAYQVSGEGAQDLLFRSGMGFPIDLFWDDPGFVRFAKRLGGFARVVMVDFRGVGASGGDLRDSVVEEIGESDVTSVLDAVGCQRVVLFGTGLGGPTAIRYAAHHPERVQALVLVDTFACFLRDDDYPWGMPPDSLESTATAMAKMWGTGKAVDFLAPSRSGDETFRAWWARAERLGSPVNQVAANWRALVLQDVRTLLPTLRAPTLVLNRLGGSSVPVDAGRYLAEHISGATFVEIAGDDEVFFVGNTDALLDEVEEFVTGSRQTPEGDVVSATILFTDMVASTERSARSGHRTWTALTDRHDAMVRATLARYRGREVKTTGDGFLATFDAATRGVRAATEIATAARGIGLEVRAGVHTGEVEMRPDDVVGLAVTIAKRICDLAGPGQVLVSETVKGHLVGSGIALSEQGRHVLKGLPDEWHLYAIDG
jgi:class 3 adenylate cyclase